MNRPAAPANPPFPSDREVTALLHLVGDSAQFRVRPISEINTAFARANADRGAFGRAC